MPRHVKAVIDLGALQANFQLAKNYAGTAKIIAVIKADAYGHGAIEAARTLNNVTMFGVASLEEAVQLRDAGIDKPILLLSGFHAKRDLPELAALGLHTVIQSEQQLESVLEVRLKQPLVVWLKLDSGMHRLGILPEKFTDAFARLKASANVNYVNLMSHFATADNPESTFSAEQIEVFNYCTTGIDAPVSLCNSAALLRLPEARRDWVRPGIMLYGGNPFSADNPLAEKLKPVMTLESQIIAIRQVKTGESVGYGQRWVAERDSTIATLSIGYADGYPRHAPSGTPVLIGDKYAPLAGTVSMDLIGVDLTEIPEARVGDKAVLWGKGLAVEKIAKSAGTINYDLFTGISQRVSRVYV